MGQGQHDCGSRQPHHSAAHQRVSDRPHPAYHLRDAIRPALHFGDGGLGLARWPTAFFVGSGFGVFHGMVVSLALVWVVAEQHPLEEFNEAGLAVGLIHFVGHVAYGAAVGLVIAVASRI